MRILRVADNTRQKKSDFAEIGRIVDKVADKTLEQLEREGVFVFPDMLMDTKDISREQIILQSMNYSYCTGNVMGFLGCGDERLVIGSRFSKDEDGDHFFRYLLEKVIDIPNIIDMRTDTDNDNRLYNYLLFLFPHYLKAAARKGLFKQYIRRQYNDDSPKGTIELSRHIRQNTPFVGNVAYSQREFSYDNHLTELVRHTIEYIKTKPYGSQILSRAKEEARDVVGSTQQYRQQDRAKIIGQNIKKPLHHAFFREYRALQRLCILILKNEKYNIGSGSRQIYGVLFDGAWLWEEYVYSLIGKHFYHPMNRVGKDAQYLFYRRIGKIFPDFIGRDAEHRIIADAKYKPIDNIYGKDYLQILAYMFRFDAKTGYYLYPDSQLAGDVRLMLNEGMECEDYHKDICVIKHGLLIPQDAESYDSFVSLIKDSENRFRRVFLDRV
ncbi:MAG: hypothetical protein IJ251_04775 [Oscillospiraceae bacterium]|nr:hypothetical protein [Oscillospiraceae bacterium]